MTSDFVVRWMHGGSQGSGDVWWTDIGLFAGQYHGEAFSGDSPSDRSHDLWIDTTDGDNTPNRWVNGAWEVVTDKTATDAAAAAVTAQGAASAAASAASVADGKATAAALAAADAQATAGNAETIAQQAQDTASGKNKTFRETTAPSGTGTNNGDRWEQYDTLNAGGKLVATWSWWEGSWRSTTIAEAYLPLVDIGSGTYGTLAGGRLAATAIDGMMITGATIRTAPTGQRLQMDVQGLKAYDVAGNEVANLHSGSGGLTVSGALQAEYVDALGRMESAAIRGAGFSTASYPPSSVEADSRSVMYSRGTVGESLVELIDGSFITQAGFRVQTDYSRMLLSRGVGTSADRLTVSVTAEDGPVIRANAGYGELFIDAVTRIPSINHFEFRSQLDTWWQAVDGTHAWVTSENREYVRSGGQWRALPDFSKDVENWSPPFISAYAGSSLVISRKNGQVSVTGALEKVSGNITAAELAVPVGGVPPELRPPAATQLVAPGAGTTTAKVNVRADGGIQISTVPTGNTAYLAISASFAGP